MSRTCPRCHSTIYFDTDTLGRSLDVCRCGASPVIAQPNVRICKNCGKPFVPRANERRPRKFCTDRCRYRFSHHGRQSDTKLRRESLRSAA